MRLPNPYSPEETLGKLRDGLAVTCNEGALALLEQAVTKARDDRVYAKQFEEALLLGSTIEIRECLSCLVTTLSAPETRRPITHTTMPSTALIPRSTPSCSMPLTPTLSRRMNNANIPKPGSSAPAP